jgi:alpha-L-rhamnosidase
MAYASGPEAPTGLTCEYLTDPVGIDVPQPRLAWVPNHSQRGERQIAYQVLVSESFDGLGQGEGDQWDSGKTSSSESIQVAYQGAPLRSGHTYYWKVRFWDGQDRASSYSAT